MNNKTRWIFRGLFVLTIVYHIWSFINFKFQAFQPIIIGNLALTIIASAINYLIQIGIPLLFLYLSLPPRDNRQEIVIKSAVEQKPLDNNYPKQTLR